MLRRFFHSQFFAKLFCELLPATIASAIGAYLINSYFKPAPPSATAASTEMVQLMRDQQALLAEYLRKSTEAHQRADQAVAQETGKLKAAERDAIQALRDAKAAELRALATAVTRTGEASERRLAAKPAAAPMATSALPAQWPQPDKAQTEKAIAGEPLQLRRATSAAPQPQVPVEARVQAQTQNQAQNQPQVQPQPIPPQAAATETEENGPVATLKSTVSKLERLPSRVLGWFSDTIVPPRPPSDLPQRQFMKAVM